MWVLLKLLLIALRLASPDYQPRRLSPEADLLRLKAGGETRVERQGVGNGRSRAAAHANARRDFNRSRASRQ